MAPSGKPARGPIRSSAFRTSRIMLSRSPRGDGKRRDPSDGGPLPLAHGHPELDRRLLAPDLPHGGHPGGQGERSASSPLDCLRTRAYDARIEDDAHDAQALEALTDRDEVIAASRSPTKLEMDTETMLYQAPGCPARPHPVRFVATLALTRPGSAVEIVDGTTEPEPGRRDGVSAASTTIIANEIVGAAAGDLAWRGVEPPGPDAGEPALRSLVESGRHPEAAER